MKRKFNFLRKVLPIVTLLVLTVTSAWGADIVWTWSQAQSMASGTSYNYTSTDGNYTLTFLAASTSDKVNANNATITVNGVSTSYTHQLYMNAATSTTRTLSFRGISGSGYLTIVTGNMTAWSKEGTIKLNTSSGGANATNVATIFSGRAAVNTVYKSGLITNLNSATTYYLLFSIKTYVRSVIWTPASTDPAINANKVTLNADATSGEIAYTVSNPVTDATVTASTTADWISNFDYSVAGKVSFTTAANETDAARQATVTLSYGLEGETAVATTDVTITQKKPVVAVAYDKIDSKENAIIGGTYVWLAARTDNGTTTYYYAKDFESTNKYFNAPALAQDSRVTATQAYLTDEAALTFSINMNEEGWTVVNNSDKVLAITADKAIEWKDAGTDFSIWAMNNDASFQMATTYNKNTTYKMLYNYNSGSPRVNAYSASNSYPVATLYHLASESAHTLSCVIDNETTETYKIKEGFTWTLLTPEKAGSIFEGWFENNEYTGSAVTNVTLSANKILYAKWRVQSTAPSITTDLNAAYNCNKGGAAVTLTIEATDADSYQWYKNSSNTTEGATAISGATEATYSYTGTIKDAVEYIYCVATNTVGSTNSTIAAVTTKGSNLAVLSRLSFSNGFAAFITTDKNVTGYYMAGESAPTVDESSIVVSANATKVINGNTLTVTAEDGETMVDYTIVLSAVTPTTTAANEAIFDGNETWVKTGYGWDATKGWKFSKNTESDGVVRITDGRNRQYWFVGPATEFTLINTGITSDRNIKVYVNGVVQNGITKIEKASGSNSISITGLSATGNNMIAIVSNQEGGDGGFTKYTFAPTPKYTINYYVNGTKISSQEDVFEGTQLVFPDVNALGGKVFRGWKKGSAIDGVLNAFTDFAATNVTASETTDYYAVFATAKEGAAGVGAKKISLAAGDKIYLATAADGEGVTGWNGSKDATISSSVSEWIVFNVEANPSNESVLWLYSEDYELYVRGTNGNFKIDGNNETTNASPVELDGEKNNIVKFLGSNYFYKRYYDNSGTMTTNVRCYNEYKTSAEFTPMFAFAAGSGTTYSAYCTTVELTGSVNFVATDGNTKYATFSSDRAVEFGDDVTVYTVTVEGTSINLNEVSKQVPANTGVLLTCDNDNANYDFIASAESLGNNNLRAASVAKEATGYKFYKLAYGDAEHTPSTLGFYWGEEDGAAFTSREGSAYLAVPVIAGAPARFVFNEANTATGLDALENIEDAVKFMKDGQLFILRNGVLYNAIGQVVK